jgi:hypothetical protein
MNHSSTSKKAVFGIGSAKKLAMTSQPGSRKSQLEQGMGDHDALLSPRSMAKQCAAVGQYEQGFMKHLNSIGLNCDNAMKLVLGNHRITDASLNLVGPQKHFSRVMSQVFIHISKNTTLLNQFTGHVCKTWLSDFEIEAVA